MSIDLAAIRQRLDDMQRHYDQQDEAEFSLAATESLEANDLRDLLDEVAALRARLGDR